MTTVVDREAGTGRIVLPQSDRPTVSIVTAVASNADLLANCLASVSRSVDRDFPLETILVLNDASEDVLALARERVSGVRLHHSRVNLGFGGATNLGCSLARGGLLLILHDDTRVEPGFLEPLMETLATYSEAGAVGSMIVSFDGPLQDCGCVLWRSGITTPPWIGDPPSRESLRKPRAVDYCGTSALLVSSATWRQLGGFDEQFFPAYYNDVDLCMSIRKLGQTVMCDPRSVVHHRRGASTNPHFKRFISMRNRVKFCSKWQTELEDYEPWHPNSQDALLNALDRTRRRAERARTTGPAANGILKRRRQPANPGLSADEQSFLLADVALKDAYVREVAQDLDRNTAELARMTAEIKSRVEMARQQHRQIHQARREIDRLTSENDWLHRRSLKLDAIESGGWWRLRAKLSPLLRLAGKFRR